ncbi:MAG: energy transducer TonB [Bacteroidota bacterium]
MKKQYTINIPKPCHEDWDAMTPNAKGRHCLSCAKTVVDFTQMDTNQIRTYLSKHSNQSICGRIMQKQLSTIQIEIPTETFRKKMSFHKIFLLALLISMGTSLLSCSNGTTASQKIESVSIVASEEDIQEKVQQELDTLALEMEQELPTIMGALEPPIKGKMQITETSDGSLPFAHVDQPPEFQDTPQELTIGEKNEFFKNRVREHIVTNFEVDAFDHLELTNKQRIYARFTITETGTLKNIQIRTSHPEMEQYAIKIIERLPVFKPAMHQGKPIDVVYMVPIIFQPT